ncbi:class III lanthipeptide [Streptomyces sp. PTD5-9]
MRNMSIIELQGLEVPAESAEALGSTISNNC